MTRKRPTTEKRSVLAAGRPSAPGQWMLQDAKARFSELVRRAKDEGPQHVTVHGREEVVVVAADQFRQMLGTGTGADLVAALGASPHLDISLEVERIAMPVRDVSL